MRTKISKRIALAVIAVVFAAASTLVTADSAVAAEKTKYQIKVNTTKNVVTVYKLNSEGKYKPYRAMVCSCGKTGSSTPTGTYRIQGKWRWLYLVGNVWGQYDTQFYGNYLFHSVYYNKYGKKNTLVKKEYNKLGRRASHGCVRLSVIDAKWIYENCKAGTKVIVYKSSNPGPLGKPKAFKVSGTTGWDPLDPDKNNPDCILKGPKIDTSAKKIKYIKYGGSGGKYTTKEMKKNVKVSNPYCIQDLTWTLKISYVAKKNPKTGKYVKQSTNTINTKKPGRYRIVYKAKYKYCGTKTKYVRYYITVKEKPEPPAPVDPPEPVNPDNPDNPDTPPADDNSSAAMEVTQENPASDIENTQTTGEESCLAETN